MLSENRDKYQPNNNTNICNIPITERHFYGCLPYGLSQWRLLVITDAQPWVCVRVHFYIVTLISEDLVACTRFQSEDV